MTALLRGAAPTSNVFEATVQRLGQSIKLGLFKPGQKLPSERDLADIIGVSRVTVRAAIQVLASEDFSLRDVGGPAARLWWKIPQWEERSKEAGGKPVEASGFLDRRFVLETGICELASERASESQIASLRQRVGQLGELVDDIVEFRRQDAQLHIAFAEATGNSDLVRMSAELQAELTSLIALIPPSPDALSHSNLQHARIVACIAKHDASGARLAIAEHIQGTRLFLGGLLPGSRASGEA
ncbi:MAG: FadR family transcriptional regulator [Rhodobacter sp.]|nr:FadR family transcriptional regulator [Rhodobacter sp.]